VVRALSEIRRIKSEKRLSMKAPIKRLRIESAEEETANVLRGHVDAICEIAVVEQIEIVPVKRGATGVTLQKDADFQLAAEF